MRRLERKGFHAGLAFLVLTCLCAYSALSLCLCIPDNDAAVATEDAADDSIQTWILPSLDKKFTLLFCLFTSVALWVVTCRGRTYVPPLVGALHRELIRTDRYSRGPPGYCIMG